MTLVGEGNRSDIAPLIWILVTFWICESTPYATCATRVSGSGAPIGSALMNALSALATLAEMVGLGAPCPTLIDNPTGTETIVGG